MLIANTNPGIQRRRPMEHRTEPRIIPQMEAVPSGNAKLRPTVFMPSAVRLPKGFLAR